MSSNNTIEALRDHLFATLADLRKPDSTLTLERAKAINETAQTIINSAKAEISFMELTGTKASGFIPTPAAVPAPTSAPAADGGSLRQVIPQTRRRNWP